MTSSKIEPGKPENEKVLQRIRMNDFPVVGIGASAGGLEALEQFFTNMPENNGMAFAVIQHLDPTHIGIMPELLQRFTPMKVLQASDRIKVKPNSVYVIPPNKSMSLLKGALHLFDPLETRGLRLPVDIFFRSLALDRMDKSIGIVLSGMGSDGSLGLKAIKEENGLVMVQEPSSAKFDGMPTSAIKAVVPDIVAPAGDLPAKLIDYLKFVPSARENQEEEPKNTSNLEKIIILLRNQSGHDFSLYKKNTLFRRIERRKGIHQIDKLSSYVRFLQENPKEVEILFKELLIGVTSFFRDSAVWENLKENVLPAMINELPNGYVLRAWVTGCSTGEEAFSLAIVFKEVLGKLKKHKNISLQIFATDLDHDAIELARKSSFPSSITADISAERLSRFFTAGGDGYTLNSAIREMVVFAVHNVIKDPPFTKLDILTCRNMMIYMEPELQHKLMILFNYSLKQGGILILGTAETPGKDKEGFEELDAKLKTFRRTISSLSPDLIDFPSAFNNGKKGQTEKPAPAKAGENIQSLADQILLQRYAPPSVLVTEKGDIVYITGRTGKYLEPVAGKANWNIHAMAREGLRHELPGAFRKVMQSFNAVVLRNIKVGTNGGTQYVDVTLQRIENPALLKGMVMVVFNDVPERFEEHETSRKNTKRAIDIKQSELELELQRRYEDLQSTREEMQTSQEELKSTNEELQSTNEELQSTNEELTTSKEEMQSLNEEMQTVNIELQSKIIDLEQTSSDMKNLLNSTGIATIFLDKELNIRRFTDHVTTLFKLRNADIGRPLTDLVTDLNYSEMKHHAQQVLKNLTPIETTIAAFDGRLFIVKIIPYRTLDDRIGGLVITFVDTTATQHEKELLLLETRYRRLFESAKDGILLLDAATGKIMDVNPILIQILGYSQAQFLEKSIWEIGLFKDIVANREKFIELQQKDYLRYEDLPLETADGRTINVEFISNVYLVNNKKVIQCSIRDITERKRMELELAISEIRYRRLFESAKDGILILDADSGMIIDVNPFLIELLGFPKQIFMEKAIWDIGFLKDVVANKAKFKELQQEEYIRYENLPLETADGQTIYVEFISNIYLIDKNKIMQCIIRDITVRKRQEEALWEARKAFDIKQNKSEK